MENPVHRKKLKSYSALACSLITASGAAEAQVVHTDLEPDVVVNCLNASYELDLNNDGICDFTIKDNHRTFNSSLWKFEIDAEPASGNSIAGEAGPGLYNHGEISNAFLTWQDAAVQPLAYVVGSWTSNGLSGGNWANSDEKFMALRFKIDGQQHLGWVRLSVDAGYAATIQDYAYDQSAIARAAETGNAITVSSASPTHIFNITSDNTTLHISALQNFSGQVNITIINMLGRVVRRVSTGNNICAMNLSDELPGLYIIHIEGDEMLVSEKFLLKPD